MEEYKIQGSGAWLEFRQSRVGASEASVCAGLNPYKTPQKLYEEKTGVRKVYSNAAMRRGTELEPVAMSAYEYMTGNAMFPDVLIHPEREWMFASLDGYSISRDHAVEIKCPGPKNHLKWLECGEIDEMYQCQMVHQMMVCGLKEMDFFILLI